MWWNSYVYFILSFPCCLLTFSSSIFPHWCELAPSWKLSRAIILLLSILLRVRNTWTLTHLKGGFSCVENRQSKVLGAVISTVRSISIYTMMQSLSFCLWTPPRWILNQTIKLWLKCRLLPLIAGVLQNVNGLQLFSRIFPFSEAQK